MPNQQNMDTINATIKLEDLDNSELEKLLHHEIQIKEEESFSEYEPFQSFHQSNLEQTHLRYECYTCQMNFHYKSILRNHLKEHKPEKQNVDTENCLQKKRVKRNHLSLDEKYKILNAYKSVLSTNSGVAIDETVKCIANKSGVCSSTVYKIINEYKNNHTLSIPKMFVHKSHIFDSLEEFQKVVIRRKVHEFYFKNELPTVDKIFNQVNNDSCLPNFKVSTFNNIMKQLNFVIKICNRNRVLLDRDEIVIWRRKYLMKIEEYRSQGRKIYYLDETCLNSGHCVSKSWVDNSVETSTEAFTSDLSSELENLTGKRIQPIFCHIGSEDGFVPSCFWAFQSKKSGKHLEKIKDESFENWFANTLPKLEKNSVVVLDNASYHSRKFENIPNSSSSKESIKNWLLSKDISFTEDLLRVELLNLVKIYENQYDKYVIDELAKEQNKIILRLPPYHCEFNPIELIWAQVKTSIARKNTNNKNMNAKDLFNEALEEVTAENWKNCVQHVLKIEKEMWELDNIIEVKIESLEFTVKNESGSDLSE